MESTDGAELLKRYNNGTATPEEIAMVESWLLSYPLDDRATLGETETQQDLDTIRQSLIAISNKPVVRKLWYRVAAAAIFLLFLSAGLYVYLRRDPVLTVAQLAKNDILPGKNGATLTLSDGKQIKLDEGGKGRLANEDGVNVDKDASGHILYKADSGGTGAVPDNLFNILSTSNGEQFQIDLPDGTKVWLNAASSLKYSPSFAGKPERLVELTGEGYFEVAKDKEHPFIVKTATQEIRVLGTHFDVNSYADEPGTTTTLLEGAVTINKTIKLLPGQQSVSSASGNIEIKPANLNTAVAWKNGLISFNEMPLPAVMRQISRWYNLEVVYQGPINNDTYNGVIDRKANLSRILKILERGGVRFQIQGKKLIVTP